MKRRPVLLQCKLKECQYCKSELFTYYKESNEEIDRWWAKVKDTPFILPLTKPLSYGRLKLRGY